MIDAGGGLSVGTRLNRIENKLEAILTRLEVFAKAKDLHELDARVASIERSYVSRGTLWAMVTVIVAQFLVILGLGLAFIYEVLNRHG